MSELIIKCPHCANDLSIDPAWLGMELECPICHNSFTAAAPAPAPAAPVPPVIPPYIPQQEDDPEAEYRKKAMIKLGIKCFIALVVIAVVTVVILKLTATTPDSLGGNWLYAMTQKRVNRDGAYGMMQIVRVDFFPVANGKENFFYRNANFTHVSLREKAKEEYTGTITFSRGGKPVTREVYIDRRKSFTHYHFKVDYSKHPKFLEEDGDLIFEMASRINSDLKPWKYVSGKAVGNSQLLCTISQGSVKKTVRLQVEEIVGEDKITRLWVKVGEIQ